MQRRPTSPTLSNPQPDQARAALAATLALAWALSLSVGLTAQLTPTLLANLETGTEPASSSPRFGAEVGGRCIFAATTRALGREVFVHDAAGTRLLKDISPGGPGSDPQGFCVFAGRVWFQATDDTHGAELWATDGTPTGTVMVVDAVPGLGGSIPSGFTVCGNRLFFTAFADGAGREPHVTDGSAAGTRMLRDIFPGFETSNLAKHHDFECCNGAVIFFADDGVHGMEPWISDGTAAGTRLVAEITPNSTERGPLTSVSPTCCNGRVFFAAEDLGNLGVRLWSTDGTAANTRPVALTGGGSLARDPSQLTCVGNLLFFVARRSVVGTELWRSDGTEAGTALVKDILAGSSSSFPTGLVECNGQLLFAAQGDFVAGKELFRSDGTEAGTQLVADIRQGTQSSFPNNFVCCGNRVFFLANDGPHGEELFISDGTSGGTSLVADLEPGSAGSQIGSLVCCGSEVLFAATVADDREAYASDGTAGGTRRIADLEPAFVEKGSSPAEITPVGPRSFYFVATTTATGREVFFFDATTGSTVPLETIVGPASGEPQDLLLVGDRLFFTATTPATGRELFAVLGTSAPQVVIDLVPGASTSFLRDLTDLAGQHLLFVASVPGQGTELVSVNSRDLTVRVLDIFPGSASSNPRSLSVIHGKDEGETFCLFSARDDTHGIEVFATDGSSTELVLDASPGTGSSFPSNFVVSPDGTELLVTVVEGTDTKLRSIRVDETGDFFFWDIQDIANFFQSFVVHNVFQAAVLASNNAGHLVGILALNPAADDPEVYEIDQATGNVQLLTQTRVGERSGEPDQVTQTSSAAAFRSDDGVRGREFAAFDASTATITISDIRPGAGSSAPEHLATIDDEVLVSASPRTDGLRKLFALDARTGTSREILDEDVVSLTEVPSGFIAVIRDRNVGEEVFFLGIHSPLIRLGSGTKSVGYPCDGRARTTSTKLKLGATVTWTASGGRSGTIGVMLVGDALDRAIKLAGGCDLWLDPVAILVAAAFSPPSSLVNLPLPTDVSLLGVEFTIQSAWLSQAGNSINTSNAISMTID